MNDRKAKGIRLIAIALAALTYALGVIYGDIMFLSVVSHAFPTGFLAGLAVAGAVATMISALVLPVALHYWFAPGPQFYVGIIFWVADILVLALNSILAYGIATGSTDAWLSMWQQVSPATPLLAVLGWGLIFLTDSSHELRHTQIGLEADQNETYAKRLADAAKSQEVNDIITAGARQLAVEQAHRLTGVVIQPAAGGKMQLPAPATLAQPVSSNGHGPNPHSPAGGNPQGKA